MALSSTTTKYENLLEGLSFGRHLIFIICVIVVLSAATCIHRVWFHPLSSIPGPLLAKLTPLWLLYHTYVGDEASSIHKAHMAFGQYVRIAPNQVDIGDADAISPIYVFGGGFAKASCYQNFDIDGHSTIFSTLSSSHRAPRAKHVAPMFSTRNIRDNEKAIYACVDRMVERFQDEAATGQPVDILNLARSLALDTVSTHLFKENYNGINESGNRLSASAFVDSFVAVGRFFYVPTFVFHVLEVLMGRLSSDERTAQSMKIVDDFIEHLVTAAPWENQNYPNRLMLLGLERCEVKAQCKDLMFAGTDSTGMNLATICRQLALNPEKYEKLYHEISHNKSGRFEQQDIQALPYLSAVIKEGLRISMANPTQLPRVVPIGGWTFKGICFPAGTVVGCGAYELHLNERVFHRARAFVPERWLDRDITEANKHFFAFGAGSRACIARSLATIELYLAVERIVESDILRCARAQGEVKLYQWFNSRVRDERIDLVFT